MLESTFVMTYAQKALQQGLRHPADVKFQPTASTDQCSTKGHREKGSAGQRWGEGVWCGIWKGGGSSGLGWGRDCRGGTFRMLPKSFPREICFKRLCNLYICGKYFLRAHPLPLSLPTQWWPKWLPLHPAGGGSCGGALWVRDQ